MRGLPDERGAGAILLIGPEAALSMAGQVLRAMWWIAIFPVLHMSLPVISANLPGDWLRDALDTKLR